MQKPPAPRDRELREVFGQLCDQATDAAASFRACRCNEDVRSTGTDDRGAASAGDDLSDEVLKRTLARLKSQVSAPNQRKTALIDEPAENTRTVGTQTQQTITESRDPALDETITQPTDGRAESTSKTVTPAAPGEELTESPINTEIPAEPARGPLTLMRLPREIRALIWWEAMRPEGGFVPLVPWTPIRGSLDDRGRIRIRTALIDRKIFPFDNERSVQSLANARSWEREDEHLRGSWPGGWALLYINKQIYAEAEAAYWRRVVADGVMLSFGCGRQTGDYWGVAVARTFFDDFTRQYLRNIQRIHLDLRRPDRDDGPNGYGGQAIVNQRAGAQIVNFGGNFGGVLNQISTRLTSLRHLSLTFSGWVPDVRQTPVSRLQFSYHVFLNNADSYPQWINDTDYPDARLQPSEQWVTRLQNITGLTRLRLRVMYAPRDPDTINERLDRDPGVQRTVHFMSMLRASMLVKGDALGVGNMRAWADKRYLEFATAERFRPRE